MALDLFAAVIRQRQPLDEAIDAHRRMAALPPRDRAFARLLATTGLRRLGQIDGLLASALDRPLARHTRPAQDILRLAVAQLAFLQTPPHAAVSTALALLETTGRGGLKGLANAVLRRIAASPGRPTDSAEAVRKTVPDWLWRGWTAAYGADAAHAIARAHLGEPPLDLTLREPAAAPEWAGTLGATQLPTGTLRLGAGTAGGIPDLAGFEDGAWWVQDAAAALPARLFGDVAGQSVVDLCAAPGGKTLQLAAASADVIAVDRSENRLARLRANLDRTGLSARTVAADATAWKPDAPVPAVLLDAPCSATGTIRRHPDIPHLKRPDDQPKLTGLQTRLFDAAAALLAPGGRLVWCVCSLQPEEGEDQVAAALARNPDLVRDPIQPEEVPGLHAAITDLGELRTLPSLWPEHGGIDGFHISRLRRRGDGIIP